MMNKKAVVLLSGGIDSTTALAIAGDQGFEVYALTIDYGQRHHVEVTAAALAAQRLGAKEHIVQTVDLSTIARSALTSDISVPKGRSADQIGSGIPVTYVPARNLIMLSIALSWAETIGASDIFIGVNAIDYSGYPDCRPEFIEAFQQCANLATRAGVEDKEIKIRAPLKEMTKGQIIKRGIELGVDYGETHSCYDPDPQGLACGECDSCLLRKKGFLEAGIEDPTEYRRI